MTRPVRELKGFARVAVPAGGSATVRFELHAGQLGFYGRDMTYLVEPGVIEIHLGTASDDLVHVGDLAMNQDTHEVTVRGAEIELSPTEFKLLRYLMLNANRVLSKAQILDHVWEYDFNGDVGIVESYISYLRRKIDDGSSDPMIVTKRGFGYMLKSPKA